MKDVAFKNRLAGYKNLIDGDIAGYAQGARDVVGKNYGSVAQVETDAFLGILDRGGKRIRGALVMVGYEMCGGKNQKMIVKAARAIEMLHAFFLMIDDIQDRSAVRRGGPSAHKILAQYHKSGGLKGDAEHFGVSVALDAAISGMSAAHIILAGLDADPQLRLNALSIVDRTLGVTAHGQTYDILNETNPAVSMQDIENVMLWKTAEYTVLNPLCVGMVLAGADCHATDATRDYALNAGVAFQITDDIISTFGDEQETGKSPMDDLREGKRTILTEYALAHADTQDKEFMLRTLGNAKVTNKDFERYKTILTRSGAVTAARAKADEHISVALLSLQLGSGYWDAVGTQFLHNLAEYLANRIR
jgi:geranylgeranyl diphosphate synthase type I